MPFESFRTSGNWLFLWPSSKRAKASRYWLSKSPMTSSAWSTSSSSWSTPLFSLSFAYLNRIISNQKTLEIKQVILEEKSKNEVEKLEEFRNLSKELTISYKSRATQDSNIDLVITVGGDGTILWALKFFRNFPIPPLISFDAVSICFLCIWAILCLWAPGNDRLFVQFPIRENGVRHFGGVWEDQSQETSPKRIKTSSPSDSTPFAQFSLTKNRQWVLFPLIFFGFWQDKSWVDRERRRP